MGSIKQTIRKWLQLEASTMVPGLTEKGTQKSLSPESSEWSDRAGYMYGVAQPWDLTTYRNYFLNDSTCNAVIKARAALTLSEIVVSSESSNPELDRQVLEFNRRIKLYAVLQQLLEDCFWAGYCVGELILTEDETDIIGIQRIDPRTTRIRVDRYGRIVDFVQIPFSALSPSTHETSNSMMTVITEPISLGTSNIFYFPNSNISVYGCPLLVAATDEIRARKALEELSYRTARALSYPIPIHRLEPDPNGIWQKEDYDQAIADNKAAWKDLNPGDSIHEAGSWKHEVFAASDHIQQIKEEVENANSQILATAGVVSSAIGLAQSKGGFSQSVIQAKMMTNQIRLTQLVLCEALNRVLYTRFSDVYNLPNVYVEMKLPILEDDKTSYEAMATLLNNADRLFRMGVIDESTLAQMLGYDKLANPERLSEYIEKNQMPQSPVDQSGDRNISQREKSQLDRKDNDNG